jgi:hypothetical protein
VHGIATNSSPNRTTDGNLFQGSYGFLRSWSIRPRTATPHTSQPGIAPLHRNAAWDPVKSARLLPLAARLSAVACCALWLPGCSIYLHDDGLEKKTGSVLSTYKAANVPAAIKATLDAQSQLDEQMVNSAIVEDTAFRDADFARLLYADPSVPTNKPPASLLVDRINVRLTLLGGSSEKFDLQKWRIFQSDYETAKTDVDHQIVAVSIWATAFASAGGTGFTSCGVDIKVPDDASVSLKGAKIALTSECTRLKDLQTKLKQKSVLPTDDNGVALGGVLGNASLNLASIQQTIADDQSTANAIAKTLATAKANVDEGTKASNPAAKIQTALTTFKGDVAQADALVGSLGAPGYKPSAALAAIQFRKTNLYNVIDAGANSTSASGQSGAKPDPAALAMSQSIAGLLSGVSDVTGRSPGTATLSIALAYQTALESGAQASLASMLQKQSLLQDERSAAILEAGLLLEARDLLTTNAAALESAACQPPPAKTPKAPKSSALTVVYTLGDVLTYKNCGAHQAVALALTDYMFSWTRGQTAERIDDVKISQLNTMLTLQITQTNAISRDVVLTTAFTELDALGQGGVDAKTIAAFLQAIGIGAIARGVN